MFAPRLARSVRLLLLCDYDGTLTPIVARPSHARLPRATRALLRQLAGRPKLQVGVVSGRAVRDVRAFVRLPGLIYVGNHGCEILGRHLSFIHPQAVRAKPRLQRISRQLADALRGIPGSLVEPKGLSLSVHWRRVPPAAVRRFHRIVRDVLRPWVSSGQVRITRGKCVVEVRAPVAWDKGRAVSWLSRRLRRDRRLALCYVGDDRTDEDAFRVVNRLGGVSVKVGGGPTSARWRLAGPAEVRAWLRRLSAARATR